MAFKKSMSQKLRMDGRDYSRPGWYFVTLGEVINMFKGSVTREWRRAEGSRHGEKEPVWAPNYYDVICFDAAELATRERYIRANPRRWALKGVPQGIIKKSRFGSVYLWRPVLACPIQRVQHLLGLEPFAINAFIR